MRRGAYSTPMRIAAAMLMMVIGVCWGWRICAYRAAKTPDYSAYTADELSWVEEGILERISEMEDELERVRQTRMSE